mmetsp:Transcript_21521/g.54224  ORF Transcript_21521/g.54224 Transcript_21521/m.54224 type:complete len:822 (-) Transcript_21521:899-3364(-)|eukprot:CAMPEP_0178996738 /NCGR_PEP_ID=MMETSP0795-20121207/8539_1 /TAXON_ID=88552 /ORGANISM="Amoebophrya sp., Strain Ameob2" /LENGTH=821 /DNA_ID=CAMNT_0020689169 /DNA_START=63 /DNA_END=2528 /DNA_ORIENTATION=-
MFRFSSIKAAAPPAAFFLSTAVVDLQPTVALDKERLYSFPTVTHSYSRPAEIGSPTSLYANPAPNGGIEISAVKPTTGSRPLARASFSPKAMETGWSYLNVQTDECEEESATNGKVADVGKAYAAGYLEGYLMMEQIQQFKYNTEEESGIAADPLRSESVLKVMTAQDRFVGEHDCTDAAKTAAADEKTKAKCRYAHQAFLVHSQLHGVLDGHNNAVRAVGVLQGGAGGSAEDAPKEINMGDLLRLNADGAISDYLKALYNAQGGSGEASFVEKSLADWAAKSAGAVAEKRLSTSDARYPRGDDRPGRCSALAKLLKNDSGAFSDVYLGHSSWEDYSEMNRVWKIYDFPFCEVNAKKISFSSYPGAISSTDDFMITQETQLGIAETSLGGEAKDWGTAAFVAKEKKHVPDYVHIMVVTRLAANGLDWMRHFSNSHNTLLTGAYNSQWMLVDYNLFKTRPDPEHLSPFTFMVLETAPRASTWQDMTARLERDSFWASFNEPYFETTIRSNGERYDPNKYYEFPRYRAFHERQKRIATIEDMKTTMRAASASETIDGQSENFGYAHAICSRPDLGSLPHLVGCCDSKVVSAKMVEEMNVLTINGPSTVGNNQPFSFNDHPSARHKGLPDTITWGWYFATDAGLEVAADGWNAEKPQLSSQSLKPQKESPTPSALPMGVAKPIRPVRQVGQERADEAEKTADRVAAAPVAKEPTVPLAAGTAGVHAPEEMLTKRGVSGWQIVAGIVSLAVFAFAGYYLWATSRAKTHVLAAARLAAGGPANRSKSPASSRGSARAGSSKKTGSARSGAAKKEKEKEMRFSDDGL